MIRQTSASANMTSHAQVLGLKSPSAWWSGHDAVTFWHGTSSALLERIFEEGLVPPPADLSSYASSLCERFVGRRLDDLPPKVRKGIEEYCLLPRRRQPGLPSGGAGVFLYPHPALHRSAGYAQSFAKDGGEIAYTVRRHLETWRRKNPIAPLYADSESVVVRVDLPIELCLVKGGGETLTDRVERLRTAWERHGKEASFDVWMSRASEFEIVVDGPVEPEFIVSAHSVRDGRDVDHHPLVVNAHSVDSFRP